MDEKLRILKMVEEGTVTAEQALELMAALGLDEKGNGEAERTETDREDTGAVAVKRYEKKDVSHHRGQREWGQGERAVPGRRDKEDFEGHGKASDSR